MPDNTLPQQSDPVLNFSDDNSVYLTIIGLQACCMQLTRPGADKHAPQMAVLTWPTPAVAVDPGLGSWNKEWFAVDTNPSSPYHRAYVAVDRLLPRGPPLLRSGQAITGPHGIQPLGDSFVTVVRIQQWRSILYARGATEWNCACHMEQLRHSDSASGKSTDGGQSFINPNTIAASIFGVNPVPGANWRLNTIPATM